MKGKQTKPNHKNKMKNQNLKKAVYLFLDTIGASCRSEKQVFNFTYQHFPYESNSVLLGIIKEYEKEKK